ncbi:MAG: insulinase family protein [Candidatus Omnitrophica bacterium]|nr:insulinase family protein [Candidatus Omnitrophota bacterium]
MYKKIRIKNGLNVVVSPMPGMTSVTLGIWIGVGGRYESQEQSGISHFVEHMLFKGTHTRTTKDLKESIEGIGGAFNGFTSDEVTCYMVKVPAKYTELGLDVLTDMVLDAKFDEEDITRERSVICEEIKMYRDQPSDHILDLLSETMWPDDALGRPLTGSIANVKKIKRKELINFRDKNYQPGNIAVVAAGKVDPEKVACYVRDRFKNNKKSNNSNFKKAKVTQNRSRIKIRESNTNQAHIAFGFHASRDKNRERFAIKMMNVILGGNMSSRLFEELREKHGLCYDISSSYKRHSDIGEVQIHAGVDAGKAVKSVVAILDELKKLRDLGVSEDELSRAKEYAKGQFLLAIEATSTRMMWLGDRFMVHRNIPEVKDVLKSIDSVGIEDIQKVSQSIFKSSFANLAVIGKLENKERNKIRKEVNKL